MATTSASFERVWPLPTRHLEAPLLATNNTPSWNAVGHNQGAMRERHWQPPKRNLGAPMATASAPCGNVHGQRRNLIRERPWPLQMRHASLLLAAKMMHFGTRALPPPTRHFGAPMATATAPFGSTPGHRQHVIL